MSMAGSEPGSSSMQTLVRTTSHVFQCFFNQKVKSIPTLSLSLSLSPFDFNDTKLLVDDATFVLETALDKKLVYRDLGWP